MNQTIISAEPGVAVEMHIVLVLSFLKSKGMASYTCFPTDFLPEICCEYNVKCITARQGLERRFELAMFFTEVYDARTYYKADSLIVTAYWGMPKI